MDVSECVSLSKIAALISYPILGDNSHALNYLLKQTNAPSSRLTDRRPFDLHEQEVGPLKVIRVRGWFAQFGLTGSAHISR